MRLFLVWLAVWVIAACPRENPPDASVPVEIPDAAVVVVVDAGPEPRDAGIPPSERYCEKTMEMFCAFYLRCGRIAVDNLTECRETFLQTCNARYEPRYSGLEDAGLLDLNDDGIAACATHLESVTCEQHIRDLDGPCADMWVGNQPRGGICGLDVESLVCSAGSQCTLGLDFCGTCKQSVADGGACGGDVVCDQAFECVAGGCRARAQVGESCDGGARCILGASCQAGLCAAPAYVLVGDVCDQTHRCPYKSLCLSGRCARAGLLGEPCGATRPCASGTCGEAPPNQGVCVALLGLNAPCPSSEYCSSGQCVEGFCRALPGFCF